MTLAWPLPVQTLSPSSIRKFHMCAEQFRRQYILGERDRSSVSAVMGNAVHGAAEYNYRQKIVSYRDLPIKDLEDAYVASFDEEVEKNGGPGEVDWTMSAGRGEKYEIRPGVAKDKGLPALRKYMEEAAPTIQPIGAEEWFRIAVEGVPIEVRGKIDIITATEKSDMKFGKSAKERPESSWLPQAYIYMLVDYTSEKDGTPRVTGLGDHNFSWHSGSWGTTRTEPKLFTPANAPELRVMKTAAGATIGKALVRNAAEMMVAMWERYGPDNPWPTTAFQHPWACGYCPYGPSSGEPKCFWWTGERDVLTLF